MPRVIDLAGNTAQAASVMASANAQRAQPYNAAYMQGVNLGANAVEDGMRRYDYLQAQGLQQQNIAADNARQDQYLALAKTGADRQEQRYNDAQSAAERERRANAAILQTLANRGGVSMSNPIGPAPGMPFSVPSVPMSGGGPMDVGAASPDMQRALLQRMDKQREDAALAQYAQAKGLQIPAGADPTITREFVRGQMRLDMLKQKAIPDARRAIESIQAMQIPDQIKQIAAASIEGDPTRAHQVMDDLRTFVVKQNEQQAKQLEVQANIEKQTKYIQSMREMGILDDRGVASIGLAVQQGLYAGEPKAIAQAVADYLEQTDKNSEEAWKTRNERLHAEYMADAERLGGIISSIRATPGYRDTVDAESLPMLETMQSEAKQKAIKVKAERPPKGQAATTEDARASGSGDDIAAKFPRQPDETEDQYVARVTAAIAGNK